MWVEDIGREWGVSAADIYRNMAEEDGMGEGFDGVVQ